ncbi:MAG TPA: hypothetical protein VKB46_16685 [Pyrinomonadaceae bacterium]|nr:hypothetical protein [Pyrinomonadaceae bacterium]
MTRGNHRNFVSHLLLVIQITVLPGLVLSQQSSDKQRKSPGVGDIPSVNSGPVLVQAKDPKKLSPLERAYLDVFSILSDDNSCSRFYGGLPATVALTAMVGKLRPTYFDPHIAIRMKGDTTIFQDARTGFSFRLFSTAEVNSGGSFYRGNTLYEARLPLIAHFPPNTKEARATILLHELGHLVRTADNGWLLKDDGTDFDLSRKNTDVVLKFCREQILTLDNQSAAEKLTKLQVPSPATLVSAGNGP